jgi:hypothetical protein
MAVVCTIDTELIQDGSHLMEGNIHLVEFDNALSSLENGTRMFYDCVNLNRIQLNQNNGTLKYADEMFGVSTRTRASDKEVITTSLTNLESANNMFMGSYTGFLPFPFLSFYVTNSEWPTNIKEYTNMFAGWEINQESLDAIHGIAVNSMGITKQKIGFVYDDGSGWLQDFLTSNGWSQTGTTEKTEPGVKKITFSITNKAGSIVELDVYYEELR